MARNIRRVTTNSTAQTMAFGQRISRRLKGGEVIALVGELGAGKTTLVKGLAAGLGVRQPIRSPTFLLMRVYPVRGHKTIHRLVHIDAYRVKHPAELLDAGLGDHLGQPDTVIVIEWADRISSVLPPRHTTVTLRLGRWSQHRRIAIADVA